MKIQYIKLSVLFFIIFNTSSCQQYKSCIELERDGFSIVYPSNMELDESGQDGTVFILKTQKDNESDTFIENINLVITNIGTTTLDKIKNKAEQDVNNVGNVIEKKKLIINGKDCFRLIFELKQNEVDFTVIQHYLVENQKVYLLTFTSETKVFDDNFEEVNKIFLSFKLNPRKIGYDNADVQLSLPRITMR